MKTNFVKYHANGNDFIMIDNRNGQYSETDNEFAKNICSRRFGVGADGLILMNDHSKHAYEVTFFNGNGKLGAFCANAARAAYAYAKTLGLADGRLTFAGFGSEYDISQKGKYINIRIPDVDVILPIKRGFFSEPGAPQHVVFVKHLDDYDVMKIAKKIGNSDIFKEDGVNVNFAQVVDNSTIKMRPYSRGIKGEALSSGAGAAAVAITHAYRQFKMHNKRRDVVAHKLTIKSAGGEMMVDLTNHGNKLFTDIVLKGEAAFVYKGDYEG